MKNRRASRMAAALALVSLANSVVAAGVFDGAYAGSQRETKNNMSGPCLQMLGGNNGATVMDGVIKFQWGPVLMQTTVGTDGSFSGDHPGLATRVASETIVFKGRIKDAMLEADVGNGQCAAHLSLKKK